MPLHWHKFFCSMGYLKPPPKSSYGEEISDMTDEDIERVNGLKQQGRIPL